MEKNKEEIKKEIKEGIDLFFEKFQKDDEFTKIFLEVLLQNLKNEKRL